jgi:hypothetical protein
MFTLVVLTLVSVAASGVSCFCLRQVVAAQEQAAQSAQQAQSHQHQAATIAGEHAQKISEHTQRIEAHTQRVTEWIEQAQSPQNPSGDPWAKGRAEIAKRAEDPNVIAQAVEIRKRQSQKSGLIPPDSAAQSNQAEWRATKARDGKMSGVEPPVPPNPQDPYRDVAQVKELLASGVTPAMLLEHPYIRLTADAKAYLEAQVIQENNSASDPIARGLFQCAEKIFRDDRQFSQSGKTSVQDQEQLS